MVNCSNNFDTIAEALRSSACTKYSPHQCEYKNYKECYPQQTCFARNHVYIVLKKICLKVFKRFQRTRCGEMYTVFDGGNSINIRIHRSSSYSQQDASCYTEGHPCTRRHRFEVDRTSKSSRRCDVSAEKKNMSDQSHDKLNDRHLGHTRSTSHRKMNDVKRGKTYFEASPSKLVKTQLSISPKYDENETIKLKKNIRSNADDSKYNESKRKVETEKKKRQSKGYRNDNMSHSFLNEASMVQNNKKRKGEIKKLGADIMLGKHQMSERRKQHRDDDNIAQNITNEAAVVQQRKDGKGEIQIREEGIIEEKLFQKDKHRRNKKNKGTKSTAGEDNNAVFGKIRKKSENLNIAIFQHSTSSNSENKKSEKTVKTNKLGHLIIKDLRKKVRQGTRLVFHADITGTTKPIRQIRPEYKSLNSKKQTRTNTLVYSRTDEAKPCDLLRAQMEQRDLRFLDCQPQEFCDPFIHCKSLNSCYPCSSKICY